MWKTKENNSSLNGEPKKKKKDTACTEKYPVK